MADDLSSRFTFSKKETDSVDYGQFRDESYDIAVTVYDGLEEGKDKVVPDSYVAKFAPIA